MPFKTLIELGKQMVMHTDSQICGSATELVGSAAFEKVVKLYVRSLRDHDSPLLEVIEPEDDGSRLTALLRALAESPLDQIIRIVPGTSRYVSHRAMLHRLIEELYDFWRRFDRFMICHSERGTSSEDLRPYRTFNATLEKLTHLVRAVYRDMCENVTNDHPRVFRQVAAGCQVGLIAVQKDWPAPMGYEALRSLPFIRQVLINPPLIIDPPTNTRTGQFQRVSKNPLEGMSLQPSEWLCYPARVGPLVLFLYFHQRFISLGSALSNLFELADDEQVAAGPDAIYLYGAPSESLAPFGSLPTVFFDDEANNLMVAAVPGDDRFGYFGYLKKMALTLHNIVMMKRGRMPYHGAMVRIHLKDGAVATMLLIGDTAAGKSETLEAFRVLGSEYLRDLRVIADDMGSLEVAGDGRVLGYGTEIGAFIRLDDLQQGYAFGQIDRAIIMSPQKVNARVVLPITTMEEVLRGWPVDFLLYANNYEQIDDEHPILERIANAEQALDVFRQGAAMAKGTTSATGLVHSYFANIFGPPQYKTMHEELAKKTFEAASTSGIFIGQLRTRLGVPGYETTGPQEAAKSLFDLISSTSFRRSQRSC